MFRNKEWKPANFEKYGYDSGKNKPLIDGAGIFFDVKGNASIAGNAIIRTWRSNLNSFLLFFTLFWNFVVGVLIYGTWNGPITVNGVKYESIRHVFESDPSIVLFLLFPVVGVSLLYILVLNLINRTRISFENQRLTIIRGPLPCRRRRAVFLASEVKQIYVQEYSPYSQNDQPVISFRVMAQLLNSADQCIDEGFQDYSSARILEQWLERKLGIQDQVVPGEVSG